MSTVDAQIWSVELVASPNEADTMRVNTLVMGDMDGGADDYSAVLTVTQEGYGSINVYDVEGPTSVEEGESFNITLSGSQQGVRYRLLLDGNPVQQLDGTGEPLVFSGLYEEGVYSVVADYGGESVEMNGTVDISWDTRHDPNMLIEITYLGEENAAYSRYDVAVYDELGRQSLAMAWSGNGSDMCSAPMEYDEAGRLKREYLSYPGMYDNPEEAIAAQKEYYQTQFGDCVPYVIYDYRNVPEDWVERQFAPSFTEAVEADATLSQFSRGKNEAQAVKQFRLNGTSLTLAGYYPAGYLRREETLAPEGNLLVSYYDADEQLIAQTDNSGYFTYYVYDDMGLLRYVLPPMQDSLFASGTRTLAQLQDFSYYYEYDELQRVYKKYLPGAEPIIYLYDKRDRQVLMQDGNMRKGGGWLFTKYDAYDRPVLTGFCGGTEAEHRAALEQATVLNESFSADTDPGAGLIWGYTNDAYPEVDARDSCLTVAYYDQYSWGAYGMADFAPGEALGQSTVKWVTGMQTGFKERVIDGSGKPGEWLTTTWYYNEDGLTVQEIREHYPDRKEYTAYVYDLQEHVTHFRVKHYRGETAVLAYDRYFEYDAYDHLLSVEQEVMDDPNGRVVLAENTYDYAGRLTEKKLHNGTDAITYAYDLTGQLLSASSPAFTYHLAYGLPELPGADDRFDGNIAEMRWQHEEGEERGYAYHYDEVQRLASAGFYAKDRGWANASGSYNVEGLSYDLNGNIRHLLRKNASGGVLNDLKYSYEGNALSSLKDGSAVSGDYAYDANGNMVYDGRRKVDVKYNYLDLPCQVGDVTYYYSTSGRKLGMETGGELVSYCGECQFSGEYLLLLRHPEGFCKQIPFQEMVYSYALRDHLGSTRAVREATGANSLETVQATDYYPFGLAFQYADLDKNKYLFSGKELQDAEVGGEMLNLYDFGARYYDPVIGRWMSIDPNAEDYYGMNPYHYCLNAPISLIDPNGAYLDWFMNYITGDIYYNSAYSADDVWKINGESWEWLGPNNMFSDGTIERMSSDWWVITDNIDKVSYFDIEIIKLIAIARVEIEAYFKGQKAIEFMKTQGFDLKPKEYYYQQDIVSTYYPEPMGPLVLTDDYSHITKVISYQYVPENMRLWETKVIKELDKRKITGGLIGFAPVYQIRERALTQNVDIYKDKWRFNSTLINYIIDIIQWQDLKEKLVRKIKKIK